MKQRNFYVKFSMDDKNAKETFDKYMIAFRSSEPVESDGFYFLITEINITDKDVEVKGLQTLPRKVENEPKDR